MTFDELCQDRPQTFTGNRPKRQGGLLSLVGGGCLAQKIWQKKEAPSKNLSGDDDDDDDDDDDGGYDFDASFQWN